MLVGHVTRYVPASRLEYEKNPINFCSTYFAPVPYVRHGDNRVRRIIRLIFLMSVVILAYGLWIEPYLVQVREIEIVDPAAARAWGDVRLMHISDLHISQPARREERLLKIINQQQPDIIFITGDLAQWNTDPAPTINFLSKLAAPLGIYAVLGDADYSSGRRHCLFCHPDINFSRQRAHPRFLQNEIIRIELNHNKTMLVAGISPVKSRDNLAGLPLPDNPAEPVLLLSHFSRPFVDAGKKRIKLCLSGDTHGGQIIMPMILWRKLSGKGDPDHRAGLYKIGKSWLYVNRGLGVTARFPIRLGVRPEVTIITFKAGSGK